MVEAENLNPPYWRPPLKNIEDIELVSIVKFLFERSGREFVIVMGVFMEIIPELFNIIKSKSWDSVETSAEKERTEKQNKTLAAAKIFLTDTLCLPIFICLFPVLYKRLLLKTISF